MVLRAFKNEWAGNKLEGIEQCKAEIAKKMLVKNLPVKLIAELTKLPQKTILDPNSTNFPLRKEPELKELDEKIYSKIPIIKEMLNKWAGLDDISEKTGIPEREILKFQINDFLTISYDKNNEFWQKGKLAARIKIAKNMLKKELEISLISEITELSETEIKEIHYKK